MAVVQISRIQLRRGRKNAGSGLPQLSSGELGWAIDTQQLYIGNGAVSEGAPTVGNTEVLTEHSDIFSLIDTYTYKVEDSIVQTGETANTPTQRTLQDRLDDRVSIRAFGATGDGTDHTAALQRAIDQLFINTATKGNPSSRVVLYVEAGTYLLDETIYLPPYCTIVGAGKDKTIFQSSATGSAFETVNSTSTPGSPASQATSTTLNQPKYIHFEGMTITATSGAVALDLKSCVDSSFRDLKLSSDWESGDAIAIESIGIKLESLSTPVTCSRNNFSNIEISGFSYGVESKYDVTNNDFSHCSFHDLGYGVVWGLDTNGGTSGQLTGPLNNAIINSEFRDIDRVGFLISNGTGNLSLNNHFYDVGNDGGSEANASYMVIQFDEGGNQAIGTYTSRFGTISYNPSFINNNAFVPDFGGTVMVDDDFFHTLGIVQAGSDTRLFKLPADSDKFYKIEYFYRSNQVAAIRSGTLTITVDYDASSTEITDEYDYDGNSSYINSLVFNSSLTDEDGDTNIDTLVVSYTNSTTSDSANFMFKVKTISIT